MHLNQKVVEVTLKIMKKKEKKEYNTNQSCNMVYGIFLLTGLAYLYGRIQSPRPDVMPDQREGITRVAGFGFACIDTQAS